MNRKLWIEIIQKLELKTNLDGSVYNNMYEVILTL